MQLEIERRWLVRPTLSLRDFHIKHVKGNYLITQFYLGDIRYRCNGLICTRTEKKKLSVGVQEEYEYEVPLHEYLEKVNEATSNVISKLRYIIPGQDSDHTWELDRFLSPRHPEDYLVLELELKDINEEFTMLEDLEIIGELTGKKKYSNRQIAHYGWPT